MSDDDRQYFESLNEVVAEIALAAEAEIQRAIADPHRAVQQQRASKGGKAVQHIADNSLSLLREEARKLIADERARRKRPTGASLAPRLATFASTNQIMTVKGQPYSEKRLERLIGQEITATRNV